MNETNEKKSAEIEAERKRYFEKVGYTGILAYDIVEINRAINLGLTGEDQLEVLKFDLFDIIRRDIKKETETIEAQFRKALTSMPTGGFKLPPHTPKNDKLGMNITSQFSNYERGIIKDPHNPSIFLKDVPDDDVDYLYTRFKAGDIIDGRLFGHWLRVRSVLRQKQIIITCCHEKHNLFMTSERPVETGGFHITEDLPTSVEEIL